MKFSHLGQGVVSSHILLAAFLLASLVRVKAATTNRWTNAVSGAWNVADNWLSNTPPNTTFTHILITNAATKTVTVDATTASTNLTVTNLVISAPTGATNTLRLVDVTNGPLHVLNVLNVDRRSQLSITNSTLQVDATFDITAGDVTLDSGLINCTNITVRVGRTNSGSLTLNGGTMKTFKLSVGSQLSSQSSARGVCTVAGGTLIASSVISLGDLRTSSTGIVAVTSGQLIATNDLTEVGVIGKGQMTVSGGTASFAYLSIGFNAPGTLGVTGGELDVLPRTTNDWMQVSSGDDAQMTVSGGLVRVLSEFHIADSLSHTGTVSVLGGQLFSTNDLTAIGRYGVGLMTVSNATVTSTNVSVGRHDSSLGVLTLQTNGSFFALDDVSIGRFANSEGHVLLTGGLLSLANDNLWAGREGFGDLTVSNGTVQAKNLFVGMSEDHTNTPQGSVLLAGGSVALSSNLVVGTSLLSTGQVSVVGGSLTVTNNSLSANLVVGQGAFTLSQGTVTADNIFLTNNGSQFIFDSGTLQAKSMIVANGAPFVVGDGVNPATLLLQGGAFNFADGLVISPNATVTGCGTITGPITNNGTLSTNCGPSITITSATKSGTSVTVYFTTIAGSNHVLEYEADLSTAGWTAILPGVIGNGNVLSMTDNNATNATRFYRIHLE